MSQPKPKVRSVSPLIPKAPLTAVNITKMCLACNILTTSDAFIFPVGYSYWVHLICTRVVWREEKHLDTVIKTWIYSKNFLISFCYFLIRSSLFHLNTFTVLIDCSLVLIFPNRQVKSQVKPKQFYFKSTYYDIISALILLPFVKLCLLPENSVLKFEQWKFLAEGNSRCNY